MSPKRSLSLRLAVALLPALIGWAAPAAAQPAVSPYIFLLFDTSGSMNYSPACTQTQINNGDCSFLCTTGDCFVPMQGDDPASKFHQLKAGLYDSVTQNSDPLFGFASFNQDTLNVRAKHWIYQATSNGPSITGWGSFPASGAQEVFGLAWTCDTGSNDNDIGCYSTTPADLVDSWELARVRRLAKGGLSFNQTIDVYIRYSGVTYKARYAPTGSGPAASTIQTNVTLYRCNNAPCSATTTLGTQTVSWSRVAEFVSWDNASSSNTVRTDPMITYFSMTGAGDAATTNTCSGWDPNTDSASDAYSSYSLRWATDSSDPRGTYFTVGDVIPLDWNDGHQNAIAERLAPNLALNPMASPDFGISGYLSDTRSGSETFLRLKDEAARPLIASGSTPLENSLKSFRSWYSGCTTGSCFTSGWRTDAASQDPDWSLRHVALIVFSDGDDNCSGDPCDQASDLLTYYGIKTYVVSFGGTSTPGSNLECIASNGGTTAPYYPQTKQELIDALNLIYADAVNP